MTDIPTIKESKSVKPYRYVVKKNGKNHTKLSACHEISPPVEVRIDGKRHYLKEFDPSFRVAWYNDSMTY